ncbi:MAG: gamma-glutamyltransferase [Proteobacteria bacterium]|nr:gamma-glutamyltransferase [Pseudomonadota bacterium]HQR03044.1 gamma-glutamyltransferase [Rhodocyclaceae bacterium]
MCSRSFGKFVVTLAITVAGCLLSAAPVHAGSSHSVLLSGSAVAVPDRYSADAAERIFREGGNAVDAAVAVALTLTVTYPEAGNIGGGGFMTLYMEGKPYFIDYRERAPLAATRDMYLDQNGAVIPGMSLTGARAVAVPGTVAGLWEAHHRFGRLKWQQVVAPAIHYARAGFVVDAQLARRATDAAQGFAGKTNFARYFGALEAGKTFRQAELAATLERLSRHGEKDFYHGRTAALIADSMQRNTGLITREDLAQYRTAWRQPLIADWNGYRVITAPPPSSGGIALLQLLKMKAARKADFAGVPLNSPQYIHLVAEIEKRVFADRAQYLGDPDFYKVPVAQLISDTYLAQRAAEVNPAAPTETAKVAPGLGAAMPEKAETTHFSIVDKWGNAVSNTYTLNGWFGSGVIVEGTGIVLNDEMDDFSAKPGVPNLFGVVGSDANAIAPGKHPLSSMTPTLLTQDGRVVLAIGTPGGSRIFTSIFQVLSNLYDFHMPLKAAVAAFRFHHQLLPENTIFYEPYHPIAGELAQGIGARGYTLKAQDFSGDIQVIRIDGQNPDAVSDPRGRGVARVIH